MGRWIGMWLVCVAAIGLQAFGAAGAAQPSERLEVAVRRGDTLWGVARRLTPPEGDVRATVDRLRRENRLDSRLPLADGRVLTYSGARGVALAGRD